MSIYASLAAPEEAHEDDCAQWDKTNPESWEFSGKPCSCGLPAAPIIYQGSHVMPKEQDPRGGHIDIACIPAHVRYWRDNPDAPTATEPDGVEPFLRFGVNEETVVLTRRHAQEIRDTLDSWLEESATPEPNDRP